MFAALEEVVVITPQLALDAVKRGESLRVKWRVDDGGWLRGEIVAVKKKRAKVKAIGGITHEIEYERLVHDKAGQFKQETHVPPAPPATTPEISWVLACAERRLFWSESKGFTKAVERAALYAQPHRAQAASTRLMHNDGYRIVLAGGMMVPTTLQEAKRLAKQWSEVLNLPEETAKAIPFPVPTPVAVPAPAPAAPVIASTTSASTTSPDRLTAARDKVRKAKANLDAYRQMAQDLEREHQQALAELGEIAFEVQQ